MKPFEAVRRALGQVTEGLPTFNVCVLVLALTSAIGFAQPISGGLPTGTGAGVHSPDSPFAPLPQRADVLPWSVLTDVKTKPVNKRLLPDFPAHVQALNGTPQRIQGFMMPMEPGQKQRHFLLTSVPLTCSFCLPGGPESMVEVFTKTPVKYTMEPVVVEGKLVVLADDAHGLYYRIKDAAPTK